MAALPHLKRAALSLIDRVATPAFKRDGVRHASRLLTLALQQSVAGRLDVCSSFKTRRRKTEHPREALAAFFKMRCG